MSAEVTLPALLRRNAHTIPDRTAMREKRRGIWQTLTWRAYWQAVHALRIRPCCHGLPPRR